jgi:hypothetical protein
MREINHYKWLEEHLPSFYKRLGMEQDYSSGIITAHGDKCYSYERTWDEHGIPFHHGVAIYLLSYERQYSKQVRNTANGWVRPDDWVIANYPLFKEHLDT